MNISEDYPSTSEDLLGQFLQISKDSRDINPTQPHAITYMYT